MNNFSKLGKNNNATFTPSNVIANQQFQEFLNPSGGPVAGIPIPILDQNLAKKMVTRVDDIIWYLNRYSLELNFKHDLLTIKEFLAYAREWGFAGAQLHVAKGDPCICLTGESDEYLRDLAYQRKERRLDLQIDISSTNKSEIEEAVRVARAMGVPVIRCYIRLGGTFTEIVEQATKDLCYAAELAEKWGIELLLEQHEFLTGPEMLEIVKAVNNPSLGILFDFGNPVTAGREPLDDIMVLQEYIRGAHCKDVLIAKNDKNWAQLGVQIGQGDLNLPKMFFDLLMLGSEKPQVQFLAIQMVVDYYAHGHRAENDLNTHVYSKRSTSVTCLADNLSEAELQKRLHQERMDAQTGFQYCKDLVENIKMFGTQFVAESGYRVNRQPTVSGTMEL